jgi:hypothetical protein
MRKATLKHFIAANAAVFAMVAAPAAIDHFYSLDLGMTPAAYAADGTPKGQQGKPADKGHKGQGGAGQDVGGSGSGQGGPSADSDAKGPRYGGGGTGTSGSTGGKPAWAQEGIPEVELGRLNVARSPSKILDKQLTEALATIAANPALYAVDNATLEAVLADIAAGVVRVDSPLANLALLKDLLTGGLTPVSGVTYTSDFLLTAIFIGSAADKTIPVTTDTVTALYTILGFAAPDNAAAIAEAADDVRDAINTAHGE